MVKNIKYIFLDIDGVLNDHMPYENNYCGMTRKCVVQFNRLLEHSGAKIVISSAWRYMITRGAMTLKGFEYLLLTHGVNCRDKICGHTREDNYASESRIYQILDWLKDNDPDCTDWISLDDLDFCYGDHCHKVNVGGLKREDLDKLGVRQRSKSKKVEDLPGQLRFDYSINE